MTALIAIPPVFLHPLADRNGHPGALLFDAGVWLVVVGVTEVDRRCVRRELPRRSVGRTGLARRGLV